MKAVKLSLRANMVQNIQAHNKHLTNEYLEHKSIKSLIRLTHPIYRTAFIKEAFEGGMIKDKEREELIHAKGW